jgi:hypothetical protein
LEWKSGGGGVVVGEWEVVGGEWLAGMMAAKDFEKRGGKTKVRLFRAGASRSTLAY